MNEKTYTRGRRRTRRDADNGDHDIRERWPDDRPDCHRLGSTRGRKIPPRTGALGSRPGALAVGRREDHVPRLAAWTTTAADDPKARRRRGWPRRRSPPAASRSASCDGRSIDERRATNTPARLPASPERPRSPTESASPSARTDGRISRRARTASPPPRRRRRATADGTDAFAAPNVDREPSKPPHRGTYRRGRRGYTRVQRRPSSRARRSRRPRAPRRC